MKKSVLIAAALCAASFAGAGEYLFDSPTDCRHENSKVKIEFKDGAFVLKGFCHFWTTQMFKADPNKKYSVTAEIMTDSKEKVPGLTLGVVFFNDKGKYIPTGKYMAAPNGFTELAKDMGPNDTTIVIKTPEGFRKRPGWGYVLAFEAKEDLSDIPNDKVTTTITKMEIEPETMTLTIAKPTLASYPAGTPVRLHYSISFCQPVNPDKFYDHATSEWQTIGGPLHIPRGMKNFKPAIIFYDHSKNPDVYFYVRNFKLIEE